MRTREEYEKIEREVLASYASHSGESNGREYPEGEHPYRTRFQRDRDRIIHSKAFRRLEYKTQVFVNHEGDHYRTRLTHTLEVAQISRSIARMLSLNEDLAEGIALAHDLGHPPFGHSGEAVMNKLMEKQGGFEHNRQSLRIVTLLEQRYPNFPGLNLTFDLLEGISKHFTEYDLSEGRSFVRQGEPSIEAQVVNFGDEIAYNHHDLEDGLRSEMITLDQLKELEIWGTFYEKVSSQYSDYPHPLQAQITLKTLINQLVTDLVQQTEKNIVDKKIKNREDVRSKGKKLVSFSEPIQKQTAELKKFLFSKLYRHYRVERMADKANRILQDLFKTYLQNPRILPPDVSARIEKENPERVICDYIAGMTDRFALDEHEKLFDPHTKV